MLSFQVPPVGKAKQSLVGHPATRWLVRFLKSEEAESAVEYVGLLALLITTCITVAKSLGSNTGGTFNKVNTVLSS